MKKDRDCGLSYPVYPNYYQGNMGLAGPMPISGMNMPMPMPMGSPTPNSFVFDNFSYSTDSNSLSQQISSLEKRITNLENMLNNGSYSSTSYNTTNYQMM